MATVFGLGLMVMRVNEQFRYDKYFQIFPFGPDAHLTFAQGFFDVARDTKTLFR